MLPTIPAINVQLSSDKEVYSKHTYPNAIQYYMRVQKYTHTRINLHWTYMRAHTCRDQRDQLTRVS